MTPLQWVHLFTQETLTRDELLALLRSIAPEDGDQARQWVASGLLRFIHDAEITNAFNEATRVAVP